MPGTVQAPRLRVLRDRLVGGTLDATGRPTRSSGGWQTEWRKTAMTKTPRTGPYCAVERQRTAADAGGPGPLQP